MISPDTYISATGAAGRTAGQMPVFAWEKAHGAKSGAGAANSAGGGASFLDFIKGLVDVVNPLQHIPVVSTLYRRITGDEISPVARLAGGALFGGPIGAAASAADLALQKATGKDAGETALAFLDGGGKKDAAPAALPRTEIVWFTPPLQTQQEFAQFIPDIEGTESVPVINGTESVPEESRLSLAHAPTQADRPQAALDEPARQGSPPSPPVFDLKNVDRVMLASGREENPARPLKADSATVLQMQNAPAVTDGKSVPPGLTAPAPESNKKAATPPGLTAASAPQPVPPHLVAVKMMEALDKYEAMNRTGLAPARASLYGSF